MARAQPLLHAVHKAPLVQPILSRAKTPNARRQVQGSRYGGNGRDIFTSRFPELAREFERDISTEREPADEHRTPPLLAKYTQNFTEIGRKPGVIQRGAERFRAS